MKRLLLAPLLFFLTSCSNDLTIKSNIGEKHIIKESAVKIKNIFKKSDYINLVSEKIIRDYERNIKISEDYTQCLIDRMPSGNDDYIYIGCDNMHLFKIKEWQEIYNKTLWELYSKETLDLYYKKQQELVQDKTRFRYVDKNLDYFKTEINQKVKNKTQNVFNGTHAVIISYTAIFEDLNNQKSALDTKEIICLNPELSKEESRNWHKKYYRMKIRDQDLVSIKVCGRYAKFK
tara:strand:- start:214 stop:912 length:699 start_codon:yes stop_codon:yes gene_type:complete